jgi:hypothetical protein
MTRCIARPRLHPMALDRAVTVQRSRSRYASGLADYLSDSSTRLFCSCRDRRRRFASQIERAWAVRQCNCTPPGPLPRIKLSGPAVVAWGCTLGLAAADPGGNRGASWWRRSGCTGGRGKERRDLRDSRARGEGSAPAAARAAAPPRLHAAPPPRAKTLPGVAWPAAAPPTRGVAAARQCAAAVLGVGAGAPGRRASRMTRTADLRRQERQQNR